MQTCSATLHTHTRMHHHSEGDNIPLIEYNGRMMSSRCVNECLLSPPSCVDV